MPTAASQPPGPAVGIYDSGLSSIFSAQAGGAAGAAGAAGKSGAEVWLILDTNGCAISQHTARRDTIGVLVAWTGDMAGAPKTRSRCNISIE